MTTAHVEPSSAAPSPAVVRIGSPPEICDAVPYLVGFQPAHSVVVIALRGPRRRIGLVMRVDLPPARQAREVADLLVGYLRRDGAEAAVFVVYADAAASAGDDAPSRSSTSSAADRVARALLQQLKREHISIEEGLRVADGRWSSYTCRRPCCPPTGTPLLASTAEPSVLAAAMVAEGRSVLPSRAALVATLDPIGGSPAEAMRRALEEELPRCPFPLLSAPPAEDGGCPDDAAYTERIADYAVQTVELARSWSQRLADPREALTAESAARLLLGLIDRDVRDRLLPWSIDEVEHVRLGPGVANLWTQLVRHAVLPGLAAAPATLLAWHTYLNEGAGALANIAVERALDDDPTYAMAGYLCAALEEGLPPKVLLGWLTSEPPQSTGEGSD